MAIKIAKDLGKAEPEFEMRIPNVGISNDNRAVLNNCMIHLIRNALDHGIESQEDRLLKAKQKHGRLMFYGDIKDDALTLCAFP